MFNKGYIQIYTGNGKGKTTAAVGTAIRALGAGLNIYFCQFMKKTPTSEQLVFERYRDNITFEQFGSSQFITGEPSEADREIAAAGLATVKKAFKSNKYNLIIMDELNVALFLNLISIYEIIELLKEKPDNMEVIITGRNAPDKLIEIADLVSEIKEVKHYFHKGVQARKGIEE
jgi:cob(I)alamin adenosyltransferase